MTRTLNDVNWWIGWTAGVLVAAAIFAIGITWIISHAGAMVEGCTGDCDYGMGPAMVMPAETEPAVTVGEVGTTEWWGNTSPSVDSGPQLTPSQSAFMNDGIENTSPKGLLPVVKLGLIGKIVKG